MRFDHKKSLYVSGVVFALLLFIGFLLSEHKLLWIDECYSQHVSVDNPSYIDILTLHFPDGNKCPLFYVLQKINCNIFSFHYPVTQAAGSFDVSDTRSQVIIRIPSNVYMSLSIAAIFYFLATTFSLLTAIYALFVALVTPMVWLYWVEARPYSLWFLLTTAQILFYCATVYYPKFKTNKYIYISHILLVLTTPGSIVQVAIMSGVLFFKSGFKKRPLIWSFGLPLGIFLFYYFMVPVYKYRTFDFLFILNSAVPPERLFVYVIYALTAWYLSKKSKEYSSNAFFLPIFLLFLLSACLVLLMDRFVDNYQFGFFSRYLIYLVPVDILMFTFASYDLWHWSRKNFWICMNVTIFLGGLVIIRGLMTYRDILGSALYLHSPG